MTTAQAPDTEKWSDYEMLMVAIKADCKSVVSYLLDRKCPVFRPGDPDTPLNLAVGKKGYYNIVKRLLRHDARVDCYNNNGDTALHHAFVQGSSKSMINHMLRTYLKKRHANLADSNRITYLHIACATSNPASVTKLLTMSDVDVNAQVKPYLGTSYAGFAPLHFAVQNGKLDVASLILKAGANIYVSAEGGSTPLHLACRRRDVKMIDLLLTYDELRLNYIDKYSMSHFMAACMSSDHRHPQEYLDVALHRYRIPARIFLAEVASAFEDSCPGYTPLHFAAEWGRLKIIELLLNCIPPVNFCGALNAKGETPLDLAQKGSHMEIVSALKDRLSWEKFEAAAVAQVVKPETEGEHAMDDEETLDYSSSYEACSTGFPSCEQRATPTTDCDNDISIDFEAYSCKTEELFCCKTEL